MSKDGHMCPSAPWESPDAKIFGVVAGEAKAPKLIFLKQLISPSKELEDKIGNVPPNQVFRVASQCAGSNCSHHDTAADSCKLVKKIVNGLDTAVDQHAVCLIRPNCVWWKQEGMQACLRCPQIATQDTSQNARLTRLADPQTEV